MGSETLPGKTFQYGCNWSTNDPIDIEVGACKLGGKWRVDGKLCGEGMGFHWKRLCQLIWPWIIWHRWNELMLESFLAYRITGVMGPANSGKTNSMAMFALVAWMLHPTETTVLVSSTDKRSLELRIWGELKKLFQEAKERWSQCPGRLVAYLQMIVWDENEIEDFRNGVVGIPCMSGATFVGLGKYVGIKNKRIILCADEASFMARSFFDSISNLNKNKGFRAIATGNPQDPADALGLICEPAPEIGGWDGLIQGKRTQRYKTRLPDGCALQLVGTDSPNFDVPEGEPEPFPFLIGRKEIANDLAYYGQDSLHFQMMDLGVMPKNAQSRRVITPSICAEHRVKQAPEWLNDKITRLLALDAAYSRVGGDRSVLGELGMGMSPNGRIILALMEDPMLVPTADPKKSVEDQIALFVKDQAERRGIPPERCFFDSTGRATLMSAFARLWSPMVQPVEFGGNPSDRLMPDGISQKAAKELFSKFVTELWFAVRYCIEADQLCGLTDEVIAEGCIREWGFKLGNKIEVEDKEQTKKRMGRSPDLFDMLVTAVEGARRLGFQIERLISPVARAKAQRQVEDLVERVRRLNRSKSLAFTGR